MREFEYIVVSFHAPSAESINWGVLLVDPASERLHFRFRTDFPIELVNPSDVEVIQGLAEHFIRIAEESGAEALLTWLLDSASNTVRVTNRLGIPARTADEALERVVSKHLDGLLET